jgi:hypothetical protein
MMRRPMAIPDYMLDAFLLISKMLSWELNRLAVLASGIF